MLIEIPLPSYSLRGKQTTLSLNSYRNLHFHVLNKCKREYQILYRKLLKYQSFDNPIEITYTLFFNRKSASRRDLSNYGSMIDKVFCDSMVKYGMIKDDNIKHVKKVTYIYGGIGNDYALIEVTELK